MPLTAKLYIGSDKPFFDGLHGVFSDSLPDGWGRLLVDRILRRNGINPLTFSPVDRLAIVGNSGMGALTYEPEFVLTEQSKDVSIDYLAEECRKILFNGEPDNLDELFLKGGSSGGAKPKALIDIGEEAWIVKFPNKEDDENIGSQEYAYSLCAQKCGLNVSESHLFPSKIYKNGIFGTKRFDRKNHQRLHMISVCGLLETTHRIPSLDYNDLLKLTYILTRNNEEVFQSFKYMCFNVFAHNRDDHSKNFSFLYNDEKNCWYIAPAYDLTYSNSINGWHATTVNGNGENPDIKDIMSVAKNAGLNLNTCKNTALKIKQIVNTDLARYLNN